MACSVYALTACSEKEDGPKDLPFTVEMENTAYRGEDFVIKGTGFETTAKFFLRDEAGKETPLEIVGEITATQVRLDIPTDLEAGKYTVILTQAGSWELGEITLAGILNIVWPAELHIGKIMTIAGEGFNETVKVWLEAEDGTRTEAQGVEVTENGIECQLPVGVQRDKLYTIVCIQDEKEYKSDEIILTIVKRLKSIGQWKKGYMDAESQEWLDELYLALTNFVYDGERLQQVEAPVDFSNTTYIVNITYPDEKTIKVLSEDEEEINMTFTLDGKMVSSCKIYDDIAYVEDITYIWEYLDDNHFQKMTSIDADAAYPCDFTFQDGDLTKLELSVMGETHSFEFGNQLAYGMDVAVWICAKGKDLFTYSFYLDLLGKKSLHLPVKYYVGGEGFDLEYEYDEDGFVTKLTVPTSWGDPDVYEFVWE